MRIKIFSETNLLEVKKLTSHESISAGYVFKSHIYSRSYLEDQVGKKIYLEINENKIYGIINSWTYLYMDLENNHHYHVNFISSFQYFCRGNKYKIYKDTDLKTILSEIFKQYGLKYRLMINPQYDYLCQYNESEESFINRLITKNKDIYLFEQTETDVITFATHDYEDQEVIELILSDREPSIDIKTHRIINEFMVETISEAPGMIQKDFNLERPDLEIYYHSVGMQNKTLYKINSKEPAIRAGSKIKIGNKHYRCTQMSHSYDGDIYKNECILVDTDYKYLPEIKPYNTNGMEIATVVGLSEIDQQEGKIKVQFFWEDKSTPYIPILQSVAGDGFGGFALPRVGQRVSILFQNGNPSYPYVCGAFYDGAHIPPYHDYETGLKTKNINSDKCHEIVLNDKEKYIKVSSSQDILEYAQNKSVFLKDGSYVVNLEASGNHEIRIDQGQNLIYIKHGDYNIQIHKGSIKVHMLQGDIQYKLVDGKMSIAASQVNIEAESIDLTGTSINLSGDQIDIDSKKVCIKAPDSIQLISSKINLN